MRARFQTPNSVSFSGLTEFRGASSVSSSQPIICVPKRTHRVFSQNSPSLPQNLVRLSEFSSPKQYSKQYSAHFLKERKWAQQSAKERIRAKIANNQVWHNQVWELPTIYRWGKERARSLCKERLKIKSCLWCRASSDLLQEQEIPPGTKPVPLKQKSLHAQCWRINIAITHTSVTQH